MSDLQEISAADAKSWHDEGKTLFVDIRDPQSYASGHIPGAILLHDGNSSEFLAETNKDSQIVVCCYHGNTSKGACRFMIDQGFKKAYSLVGGWESWAAVGPAEQGNVS